MKNETIDLTAVNEEQVVRYLMDYGTNHQIFSEDQEKDFRKILNLYGVPAIFNFISWYTFKGAYPSIALLVLYRRDILRDPQASQETFTTLQEELDRIPARIEKESENEIFLSIQRAIYHIMLDK